MPSPKSTVSCGSAIRSFTVALGMANALARRSSNNRCRFNDSATACRHRPVSHPSVRLNRQAAYSSPLSRSTWPHCSLGGHRLRITMVMRSLVSSGVANGVPPNSSNACTNVAPLRTDARREATHATHPMAGNGFDGMFASSIPSDRPSNPPSGFSSRLSPARPTVSRPFAHIAYVSARPQPYGQSAQYRANNAEAFHLPTSIQRLHARTKSGHCCEAHIWLPFHPANRFPRSFPSANSSRPICAMRRLPPTRPTCSTTSNASCASAAVACGFSSASNPKATKREGTAVT